MRYIYQNAIRRDMLLDMIRTASKYNVAFPYKNEEVRYLIHVLFDIS